MSWYQSYETLEIYRLAFDASMMVLDVTKNSPTEGTILLSDRIRRSSRCVCHHISEAMKNRNHQTMFLHRLAIAKVEAEETMRWIKQAVAKEYVNIETGARLYSAYNSVVEKLIGLLTQPTPRVLRKAA
jgi:four helix bundle protein